MLKIKGKILTSQKILNKYSKDRSPYVIKPMIVSMPKNEKDIVEIIKYAIKNKIPITARGAGSNLSGSAVGRGIIIEFSKMNRILKVRNNSIWIQPGIIFDDMNKKMRKNGYFLPYTPSSGKFCTVGGNVGTKAAGLRSVKYGSTDAFVKNIRFVDIKGRLIDTSNKLPKDLEEKIFKIRKKILKDKKVIKILKKRENLKTSSGYNLWALYKYNDPRDIVTHLFVGSVGTLGVFTAIELDLTKIPQKRITCLAYFNSLKESGKAVMEIRKINPSALEILDFFSLDILKRNSKCNIPKKAVASLLIELDDNFTIIENDRRKLEMLLKKHKAEYFIESDSKKQEKLWEIRRDLLNIVESEKKDVIAFVEDIGVPPKHVADFIHDLENIFKKHKIDVVIFGHAGEGNLHLRPVIPRSGWKKLVKKIADECYKCAFKYGGTITGEHGIGRNKSPYLKQEWGNDVYKYFKEIKRAFDPEDLFNPEVMFPKHDIIHGMKY